MYVFDVFYIQLLSSGNVFFFLWVCVYVRFVFVCVSVCEFSFLCVFVSVCRDVCGLFLYVCVCSFVNVCKHVCVNVYEQYMCVSLNEGVCIV